MITKERLGMQKYFFQVVQDNVISEEIYSDINRYYYYSTENIRYSQADYGKAALEKADIWKNMNGLYGCVNDDYNDPQVIEAIYSISDTFTRLPYHSHLEMCDNTYIRLCSNDNLSFAVVRMKDPNFFEEFDTYLKKKRRKWNSENIKIVNVLVQDGAYRLNYKYDYIIPTINIGKHFLDIVKETLNSER